MTTPLLELRRVSKSYVRRSPVRRRRSAVHALADVSLSVDADEIVGVVGESGAGKSTLTRLVLGLEQPDAGQVRFDGVDLATLPPAALRATRRRMHLVLQDPYQSLHPGMRVGRLVAEPLAIAGVPRSSRRELVLPALAEAGLTPVEAFVDRYPHQLSGGQRQRVALARALVGRPDLVVADEPTSMLDASLRAEMLALIRQIRAAHGTAFVFVTHDLAMAEHVCDRIAVMHGGRVVEHGQTAHVIANPQHPYTRTLLTASDSVR